MGCLNSLCTLILSTGILSDPFWNLSAQHYLHAGGAKGVAIISPELDNISLRTPEPQAQTNEHRAPYGFASSHLAIKDNATPDTIRHGVWVMSASINKSHNSSSRTIICSFPDIAQKMVSFPTRDVKVAIHHHTVNHRLRNATTKHITQNPHHHRPLAPSQTSEIGARAFVESPTSLLVQTRGEMNARRNAQNGAPPCAAREPSRLGRCGGG